MAVEQQVHVTLATLDSGKREEFATGSRRDTRQHKGRYDLVSPLAMRRLALLYERGAQKYGDRNWELGQPISRYLDSAFRHLYEFLEGRRDEDHIVQAAWNVLCIVHTEEAILRGRLPVDLYDIPNYMPVEVPVPNGPQSPVEPPPGTAGSTAEPVARKPPATSPDAPSVESFMPLVKLPDGVARS